MHTRVPSCADSMNTTQVENNSKTCQLPRFPPTQSIRDSTDELYLTVVNESSFAGSSGSSSASSASSLSSNHSIPPPRKSVMGGSLRIKDTVRKVGKRRREPSINVQADEVRKFEGAGQRRSYFSSATKRRVIQFGPMVCAYPFAGSFNQSLKAINTRT